MSAKSEALELRQRLFELQVRGRRLIADNPSMEQARHYAELTDIYLGQGGVSVGFESHRTPAQQIEVSLEGIGDFLNKLKNLFKRKPAEVKSGQAPVESVYKERADMVMLYTKSNIDHFTFKQGGVVTMGVTHGGYFHKDGRLVVDPIKAFSDQIKEYEEFYRNAKGPCERYYRWAKECWTVAEKEYEKLGPEAPSYVPMIEAIMKVAHKQPKPPLEMLNVGSHSRLGFVNPDQWKGTLYDAPSWTIDVVPTMRVEAKVPPVTKDDYVKVVELAQRCYSLANDLSDFIDEVAEKNLTGDFTDYPFRHDGVQNALWSVRRGVEIAFDIDSVTAVADPFGSLEERALRLGDAILSWIKKSVND